MLPVYNVRQRTNNKITETNVVIDKKSISTWLLLLKLHSYYISLIYILRTPLTENHVENRYVLCTFEVINTLKFIEQRVYPTGIEWLAVFEFDAHFYRIRSFNTGFNSIILKCLMLHKNEYGTLLSTEYKTLEFLL